MNSARVERQLASTSDSAPMGLANNRLRHGLRPGPAASLRLECPCFLGGEGDRRLVPGSQISPKPCPFASFRDMPHQIALGADAFLDKLRLVILKPLLQFFSVGRH